MDFSPPLIEGTFLGRRKRFFADVLLDDGQIVVAHCANTGAMTGCSEPEGRVALSDHRGRGRKLDYSWELSRVGDTWICVNTARANQIVEEGLQARRFRSLQGFETCRREVAWPSGGRADFLLESASGRCWVEVKSVTLAKGKLAVFPDAVTSRGLRHLEALRDVVRGGDRGVMLFLVGRGDCESFAPEADVDPAYARTLAEVAREDVELLCYRLKIGLSGLGIDCELPIHLDPRR